MSPMGNESNHSLSKAQRCITVFKMSTIDRGWLIDSSKRRQNFAKERIGRGCKGNSVRCNNLFAAGCRMVFVNKKYHNQDLRFREERYFVHK